MVKTRAIQVRLTRDQHERIRLYAQQKGFPSVSAYLRYVGLDQDFSLHQMVAEIRNAVIVGGQPDRQAKMAKRRAAGRR